MNNLQSVKYHALLDNPQKRGIISEGLLRLFALCSVIKRLKLEFNNLANKNFETIRQALESTNVVKQKLMYIPYTVEDAT